MDTQTPIRLTKVNVKSDSHLVRTLTFFRDGCKTFFSKNKHVGKWPFRTIYFWSLIFIVIGPSSINLQGIDIYEVLSMVFVFQFNHPQVPIKRSTTFGIVHAEFKDSFCWYLHVTGFSVFRFCCSGCNISLYVWNIWENIQNNLWSCFHHWFINFCRRVINNILGINFSQHPITV